MRIFFILIVGLFYGTTFGQKSVPKYEVQDRRLLDILTTLTDSINRIHNGKWIMEIHFDKAVTNVIHPQTTPASGAIEFDLTKPSLEIDIVFFAFATTDIWSVPTAYAEINNVPCLLFTGIEPLIAGNTQTTIRKLRGKFKKRIVGGVGISHIWQVNLKNDSLRIESRHAMMK
jgi:hypothetical protein